MKLVYFQAQSMTVQGKREEVYRKYGKEGWTIEPLGGGCGNWLLKKYSDVIDKDNGKSYRRFILNSYKREKLTEKLAYQFIEDVNSGKIQLPN